MNGLGAVGAIATVFAALSPTEQRQPDPILLELLQGQQKILSQLAEVEIQLRVVSSSVLEVQRDIELFSLRTNRQLIDIAAAVDQLGSEFARAARAQSAAQRTVLEQNVGAIVEEFRVETRAAGEIDWSSKDAYRRIAGLQGFFLSTVVLEPYVVRESFDSATTIEEVMRSPWNFHGDAMTRLSRAVEFYGFGRLSRFAGGNQDVLNLAYRQLGVVTSASSDLTFDHNASLMIMYAMADVHAMSNRSLGSMFDLARLQRVLDERSENLRGLVDTLPLQIAVLEADTRNLALSWRDRFRSALDEALTGTPSPLVDEGQFFEFILRNGLNRVIFSFDCLRGAADELCSEELMDPFQSVKPERVLMAMGVVDLESLFDLYPEALVNSELGYSPLRRVSQAGSLRFEVCVPIIQGLDWNPNIVARYGMPSENLERYGYVVAPRAHCFRFPADGEPPISAQYFWNNLASRACDPRQGDCPKAFFEMISEVWRSYGAPRLRFRVPTGMGVFDGIEYDGTLEMVPEVDVFRVVRQQSHDFAREVLEDETLRIGLEVREDFLQNSPELWLELEAIDRGVLSLVSYLHFLSPDCRERVTESLLKPIVGTTAGSLPSVWLRERIIAQEFEVVYEYLEGLNAIRGASAQGYGACYASSRTLLETSTLLDFLYR